MSQGNDWNSSQQKRKEDVLSLRTFLIIRTAVRIWGRYKTMHVWSAFETVKRKMAFLRFFKGIRKACGLCQ